MVCSKLSCPYAHLAIVSCKLRIRAAEVADHKRLSPSDMEELRWGVSLVRRNNTALLKFILATYFLLSTNLWWVNKLEIFKPRTILLLYRPFFDDPACGPWRPFSGETSDSPHKVVIRMKLQPSRLLIGKSEIDSDKRRFVDKRA